MKKLIVLILIIILVIHPSAAIAADNTVSSYFQQHPEQAAQFAADLGIKESVAAPIVNSTSRTVAVEVLDASGKVVSTTSATVSNSVGGVRPTVMPRVSKLANGLQIAVDIYNFGKSAMEFLQGKAKSRFYQSNCSDPLANSGCGGTIYMSLDRTNGVHVERQVIGQQGYYKKYEVSTPATNGTVTVKWIDSNGNHAPIPDVIPSSIRVEPFGTTKTWQQHTDQERKNFVDSLTSVDYKAALDKGEIVPLIPSQTLPENTKKVVVRTGSPNEVITDKGFAPATDPLNVYDSDSFGTDSDADGNPDIYDSDDDNDGIPDSKDPDDNGDGTPDYEDVKGTPKVFVPGIDEPECLECEHVWKETHNFVGYAIEAASDKFPFDILGDWEFLKTNSATLECPTYTFWSKPYQICEVRNLFVAIKYSIWVGFIVRLIINL
jgi:hypothetical protein